jgi:hypothetical protein
VKSSEFEKTVCIGAGLENARNIGVLAVDADPGTGDSPPVWADHATGEAPGNTRGFGDCHRSYRTGRGCIPRLGLTWTGADRFFPALSRERDERGQNHREK